jgi:hypothetical protein
MIHKPFNKLPWISEDIQIDTGDLIIQEANGLDIIGNIRLAGNVEFILQACNNFPKSIELLAACKDYIDSISEDSNTSIYQHTVNNEVNRFLKKIYNE